MLRGRNAFDAGGQRFSNAFGEGTLEPYSQFLISWQVLQGMLDGATESVAGPTDVQVEQARRGTERKIQHSITVQLENTHKNVLHEHMLELDPVDPVRVSYLACSWTIRNGSLHYIPVKEVAPTV